MISKERVKRILSMTDTDKLRDEPRAPQPGIRPSTEEFIRNIAFDEAQRVREGAKSPRPVKNDE